MLPRTCRAKLDELLKELDLDDIFDIETDSENPKILMLAQRTDDIGGSGHEAIEKLLPKIAELINETEYDGQYIKWEYGGGTEIGAHLLFSGEVLTLEGVNSLLTVNAPATLLNAVTPRQEITIPIKVIPLKCDGVLAIINAKLGESKDCEICGRKGGMCSLIGSHQTLS